MAQRLASLPRSRAHETTVVLCAKYLFQRVGPHLLTSLLPPLVLLRAGEIERRPQLHLLLQLLRHEAVEPGSGTELVVPRLVDSLLVFVVRAWLEGQPVGAGGWFGALRDPAVAKSLSLMHERPGAAWSVEQLAREVAQSRATFARRFAEHVGQTPLAYLTRWRMCLAAKLLCESDLSLEEIAPRVGYETAAAFSKAFRRSHGDAPGRFRAVARRAGARLRRTDKSWRARRMFRPVPPD
jgi:transcriptional regulator GlxA family with amidase domain